MSRQRVKWSDPLTTPNSHVVSSIVAFIGSNKIEDTNDDEAFARMELDSHANMPVVG